MWDSFFTSDLFFPYSTHEMSQGDTGVPLSSARCHRAGFPVYQCSARLGHGAALSALRGSARLLRPPSGSISTLISAEAALARHDNPSQTLEVRDCSPARASTRVSDSISPAGASRSSAYPTSSSVPRRAGSDLLVDCRLPFNPWRTVPSLKAG